MIQNKSNNSFELPESSALIIAGPTASGKSSLAIELALQLDGVIINADSQQIYKGLPILSAQPDDRDLAKVPHRLYDFLEPNEICDAHRWRELARNEICQVLDKNKLPVLTGGTGLYINALVDGLSPVPDIPESIRRQTNDLIEEIGTEKFFQKLKHKDPVSAENLDPFNKRRLARAWEVLEATNIPLSQWQEEPLEGAVDEVKFVMVFVCPKREALRERCDNRFDEMVRLGAVEEVKWLSDKIDRKEVSDINPITKALGFIPLRDYLKGEFEWEEAVEIAKAQTRQYAKRQVTWFKNKSPDNIMQKIIYDPASDRPPEFYRPQ